jgi:hypothetical protein
MVRSKVRSRSQRQRGLRYELSSCAPAFQSWVRTPTPGTHVCVCIHSAGVVLRRGRGRATGRSPVHGVPSTAYSIKKLKKRPRPNKRALEPLTNHEEVLHTDKTEKNGVFWEVTPCGSCKNRRVGGTKYFVAAYVGCKLELALFLVHRFLSS